MQDLLIDHHQSSRHCVMLVPPPNFGLVEENLYRSGAPDLLNLPFLETLGLTSIIWLAPEEPDDAL
jgi:tyrosine-protein phosphatase OCA1